MAADASNHTASADSYIGSFISLTSKSDIRYEGLLFHINAQESTIGLKNVRSFGTEGRKKDGPQVPGSDRVYEYIFFRGSDIQDLQVVSSPPFQSVPALPDDPAIIQLHYPHPASASTSLPPTGSWSVTNVSPHPASACTSLPPTGSGSVTNVCSNAHLGLPSSTFQGSMPLYQPVGNFGSWVSSPSHPNSSVSGLTMPMYWQGFNGPSGGLSNLQQQTLLRPDPGLVESPLLQHQTQYPSMNASLPSSASNFPEFPHPLLPSFSTGFLNTTSLLHPPSTLQLNFPIGPSAPLPSNLLPNSMQNNLPSVLPTLMLGSSLPLVYPLTASSLDINTITPPTADKPKPAVSPKLHYQAMSHPIPSAVGTSSLNNTKVPVPFLVTPGQLMQSNATALSSSHSLQNDHKDIEVVQASTSESLSSVSEEAQASILPLQSPYTEKVNKTPMHTHHVDTGCERGRGNGLNGDALRAHHSKRGHSQGRGYKSNGTAIHTHHFTNSGHSRGRGNALHGAALHTHHSNWGRSQGRGNGLKGDALHTHRMSRGHTWGSGRGNRVSHPVTKFTEDFDFEAMNEKFNKDEVWGHLGKSNKARLKSKEWDEKESDVDDRQFVDEDALPKFEMMPVYVKDGFFDSFSCNPRDRELQRGRANFLEQMKIDTETFGDIQRHRGSRRFGQSGRSKGSYYGRGFGYAGRQDRPY